MYEIFFDVPPRIKVLEPPLHSVYAVYLSVVTCAPPPPPQFLYVADPMTVPYFDTVFRALNKVRFDVVIFSVLILYGRLCCW